MSIQRARLFISVVLVTAFVASCGGGGSSDSAPRQRNAALDATKQQCLSDADTTISGSTVTLAFCGGAAKYSIIKADGTASDQMDVVDGRAQYTPESASATVHVQSFDASGAQVGDDIVTTVLRDCSTGANCRVGDTGPGGGIVVFDAGRNYPWGRYIEVAQQGWYDFMPGDYHMFDPYGFFDCGPGGPMFDRYNNQTIAVGGGGLMTNRLISGCSRYPYGLPMFLDRFRMYGSLENDWVIPTIGDLLTIEWPELQRLGMDRPDIQYATSSLDWRFPRGQMYTYSQELRYDPMLRMEIRRFINGDPWMFDPMIDMILRRFQTRPLYMYGRMSLRPVRYFRESNVQSSVTVIGIMDIPTTTTTTLPELPSTTTTTEAPATEVLAPVNVTARLSEDTKNAVIEWTAEDTDTDAELTVTYTPDAGGDPVVVTATEPGTVSIPVTEFAENAAYSFTVTRSRGGKSATSEPVMMIPRAAAATTTTSTTVADNTSDVTTTTEAPAGGGDNGATTTTEAPAGGGDNGATTTTVADTGKQLTVSDLVGGGGDLSGGTVSGSGIQVTDKDPNIKIDAATAAGLFEQTVDGLNVVKVELSLDGETWVVLPKTGTQLPVTDKTDAMQIRLTNSSGAESIVLHPVSVVTAQNTPAAATSDSGSSSSGISPIIWVLLALVLLVLAYVVYARSQKKEPQA